MKNTETWVPSSNVLKMAGQTADIRAHELTPNCGLSSRTTDKLEEERITHRRVKIGLFNLSLNAAGGAARLAVTLSTALQSDGYNVNLITIDRTNWPKLKSLGISQPKVESEHAIPPLISLPTLYARCINWVFRDLVFVPLWRSKYDLTVTAPQTFPIAFSDIIYMHHPDFLSRYVDELYPKYSTGLRRAYALPYKKLSDSLVRIYQNLTTKSLILTNSRYSQGLISRALGTQAAVVYPPVDASRYIPLSSRKARKNVVVTIARIEESKRLHILVDLAKRVRNARFVLIGSVDKQSANYLKSIVRTAKRLKVYSRLDIRPNCTEEEKQRFLSSAKVYFHTMRGEHFGTSIVEGMSAGLIPVVHKSGGPWIDILDQTQGRYGYCYDNMEEAAVIVAHILENENVRRALCRKTLKRARSFDSAVFRDKMLAIVRQVLAVKRQSK